MSMLMTSYKAVFFFDIRARRLTERYRIGEGKITIKCYLLNIILEY